MKLEIAYFAAGCFWGVEHVFRQVPGVTEVESGYMNGLTHAPTYEAVCGGDTQHAEAVKVVFQPEMVRYEQLTWLFWHLHDPTQLNQQGPDVGTQYRSGIYTTSGEQSRVAFASRVAAQTRLSKPIATEIEEAKAFWPAEEYHQAYFVKHPWRGSCHAVPDVGRIIAECPALV